MSEVREEIALLAARVEELESVVEDLGRRLRAVEATLERAERAAIRREEWRWSAAS
jgi:hypothetical protein